MRLSTGSTEWGSFGVLRRETRTIDAMMNFRLQVGFRSHYRYLLRPPGSSGGSGGGSSGGSDPGDDDGNVGHNPLTPPEGSPTGSGGILSGSSNPGNDDGVGSEA